MDNVTEKPYVLRKRLADVVFSQDDGVFFFSGFEPIGKASLIVVPDFKLDLVARFGLSVEGGNGLDKIVS